MHAVARRIEPQAALLRAWALHGGVSAQVTAFEMARPDGKTRTLVLRVHGAADRGQNPHVAEHEYRVLQIVHAAGLPIPAPVTFDASGDILPLPYLVVEYVEGAPATQTADPARLVAQMAAFLAGLHRIDADRAGLSFLRRVEDGVAGALRRPPDKLDEELHESRIRATLAAAWPLPQRNRTVLLHGDYWPGNVLWRDAGSAGDAAGIAAVIDWEDAATGDPLADLANARLELLWAFGADAMQEFSARYLSLADVDAAHLPYWDLYAALRPIAGMAGWGLDAAVLRKMRVRHRAFTAQAFGAIAPRGVPPRSG